MTLSRAAWIGWSLFVTLLASSRASRAEEAAKPDDGAAAMTARIDSLLEKRWKSAGVVPNAPATDPEFLRRAALDLTGVIPSVSEVREHLSDSRRGKRALLVDALLKKPTHATRLANHWRDAMLPRNSQQVRFGQAGQFEAW